MPLSAFTPQVREDQILQRVRHFAVEEGIDARSDRHWRMAKRCWQWVETTGSRWGLTVLAPDGLRSATVTAVW